MRYKRQCGIEAFPDDPNWVEFRWVGEVKLDGDFSWDKLRVIMTLMERHGEE